jgi:hypothetical protein
MELPYMKLPKGLQDHLRARADANELLRADAQGVHVHNIINHAAGARALAARRHCIGRAHRAWPQS